MASDFSKNPHVQGANNLFLGKGQDLTIKHVPTGFQVEFPAFIDMFSDAYNSQWTAEDVYGRMDPISTFVNTKRAISVSWFVPADSFEHAEANLGKVNKLISFLYPLYDNSRVGGATVINQGPLMKISFGNLIRSAKTGRGLLGYVNGITFDPLLEYGMFNRKVDKDSSRTKHILGGNSQNNEYYPKTFRLNFEFTVLHEHELGFRQSGGSTKSFTGKDKKKYTRTTQTYTFNSKHLSFGNFPYLTPKPDGSSSITHVAVAKKKKLSTPTPKTPAKVKAAKKNAKANSKNADNNTPAEAQTPPLAKPLSPPLKQL